VSADLKRRGKFISLEGGEGVGKSTQARALQAALSDRGIDCILTREPGGSEGAEKIRSLLLDREENWSAQTEALLFAAARADHVEKIIRPALEAGKWVISDRFLDSSLAYQGGAGGLGYESIRALHQIGSNGLLPDRTFVLMLGPRGDVEQGRARETGPPDRFGDRPSEFHHKVSLAFQHIHADEPDRIRLIDSSEPRETVTKTLLEAIADLLP
jgi:dTMP kinase